VEKFQTTIELAPAKVAFADHLNTSWRVKINMQHTTYGEITQYQIDTTFMCQKASMLGVLGLCLVFYS